MNKFERFIYTLPPINFLLRRSKHVKPAGFEGVPLYDVMAFFFNQVKKIGFNERAAAISFNILMALPAGMIFLFSLIPYLPIPRDQMLSEILHTLRDVLRNYKTYKFVEDIIYDVFYIPRSGLVSVSFLIGVFFSSNAMMGIMRTFDRSYFEQRKGRFMIKRWTAIKLTSLLVILVFVTLILLTTQGPIKNFMLKKLGWNKSWVSHLVLYGRWILLIAMNFFTIAFIYRFAPAVKNKWKLMSPGAILACTMTLLTSYLFSLWVNNFGNYNQLYGSLGTVLIIMNLIFINSLILLVGFELNVSITAIKSKLSMEQAAADLKI